MEDCASSMPEKMCCALSELGQSSRRCGEEKRSRWPNTKWTRIQITKRDQEHQSKPLLAILVYDDVEPLEVYNSRSRSQLRNQALQKVYMCFGVDPLVYCLWECEDSISHLKLLSRSGVGNIYTYNEQERQLFVLYQQFPLPSMSLSRPTVWTFLKYSTVLTTSWWGCWGQKTSTRDPGGSAFDRDFNSFLRVCDSLWAWRIDAFTRDHLCAIAIGHRVVRILQPC